MFGHIYVIDNFEFLRLLIFFNLFNLDTSYTLIVCFYVFKPFKKKAYIHLNTCTDIHFCVQTHFIKNIQSNKLLDMFMVIY